MIMWVEMPSHFIPGVLFISFFVTFATKIEICHSNHRNYGNYFSEASRRSNYSLMRENFGISSRTIIGPHNFHRRRSTRRALQNSILRSQFPNRRFNPTEDYTWPLKRVAEIQGDIVLGGLMMIHEREDRRICGPIMPQGGVQALECMLYTIDWINNRKFLPGIKLGSYVLDDCDKDTYGLEQAVDFIKGI